MKKVFLSFLLIAAIAITGCSAEPSDDPDAKFVKGENGDWIFNFTADEFVDEWINDPFFKVTNFEVDSDESTTLMIDNDNIHIFLDKDPKKSKVTGFTIMSDYNITIQQHLSVFLYSMFILKRLDEDLYMDEFVSKQIQEALSDVSGHKEKEVRLIIGDYEFVFYSESNKATMVLIFPDPNLKQP